MCKEMEFFIYLIERYAERKGMTSNKVLEKWDELELTEFIYDMYELYHTESIENAFEDIDRLTAKKQLAGDVRENEG